jgi:hypothetical protein
LLIFSSLSRKRFSRRNDPNDLSTVGVGDDYASPVGSVTGRQEPEFVLRMKAVDECLVQWVTEDGFRLIERHTVLPPVQQILLVIPVEEHMLRVCRHGTLPS